MTTAGDLFEAAINQWNTNRGLGFALIPPPLDDRDMVLAILQRIYNKRPDCSVLIIVNNFKDRGELIEYITHREDEENNEEFKTLIEKKYIKVFTQTFIDNLTYPVRPLLTIAYRLSTISEKVEYNIVNSTYKLVVSNKLFANNEDNAKLNRICPTLDAFKQAEIDQLRVTRPVEEMLVGVDISEYSEDMKLLDYYDEFISKTINIFGSFDIVQQARVGNKQLNISAQQICTQIAKENGWNEHLDMSIEYNRQIDDLYNPINLRDRAIMVYEVIRNRANLLSDHTAKLHKILEIVNEHPDEKILIINKRGEFANLVTEYINNNSDKPICGNYHDKVDPIPAVDIEGNPLYYKSGKNKGERRTMCAQAQKTLNEQLFNLDKIRILSTNNSPDKELNIILDRIIISSPLCDEIETYLYRLSKLYCNTDKLYVTTLYCKGTLEEQRAGKKEITPTHNIIKDCENVGVDENYSDFIIAD